MSISELNQVMTYVVDGWLLFSAGFVSIGFISFASRRIQEDIEADAVALAQKMESAIAQAEESSVTETVEVTDEEAVEAARLEEVAAVSEQLAKNKGKQSDSSSVSVST